MNCSVHPDRPAHTSCARCNSPMCMDCEVRLGAETICQACLAKARQAAQPAPTPDAVAAAPSPAGISYAKQASVEDSPGYIGAAIAGLVVAVVCAIIWEKLVIGTGFGAGRVILGLLVGYAVVLGSANKLGPLTPIIGGAAAVVGILLGQYLLYSEVVKMAIAAEPESAGAIRSFPEFMMQLGFLNAIFCLLGIYMGFQIPARALNGSE